MDNPVAVYGPTAADMGAYVGEGEEPRPAPKTFPWYWIILRIFQTIASFLVFIASAVVYFSVKAEDHRFGGKRIGCGAGWVVIASLIPIIYSAKTLVYRFRHSTPLAKCSPIVLGGDITMIAILAGIKKASVRLLKKAAATRSRNNTDMLDFGALSFSAKVKRFTERIGRHHHHGGHGWGDCRRGYKTSNAGMKGRFRTCSSNEGEAWKTGWQQHFNSGNYQRVAEKCKMHFVKGTFGVALTLFILTTLIALYIVYSNRGHTKQHLSEVKAMLGKRCEERRLRCRERREARAARRGVRGCRGSRFSSTTSERTRCCDHVCSAAPPVPNYNDNYTSSDEKKRGYYSQLYTESTATHPVPGDFPTHMPVATPASAPAQTIINIASPPSTPSSTHHIRTPSISTVSSITLSGGDQNTDDEGFTHVRYSSARLYTDSETEHEDGSYTPVTGTSEEEGDEAGEDQRLLGIARI